METTLVWMGFGAGIIVALLSFLIPVLSGSQRSVWLHKRFVTTALFAGVVVIAAFLLTLPKDPPFSTGQQMGWGMLIGGFAALLAALGILRINGGDSQDPYWPYPGGFSLSLGLTAVALTLGIFPGNPIDGVIGCALGFVGVALIFQLGETGESIESETNNASRFNTPLEAGALLVTMLATGIALAVHHFNRPEFRGWWAYPIALTAFWLLGKAIAYTGTAHRGVAGNRTIPVGIAAVAAIVFTLIPGWLLGIKMEQPQALAVLLASGLITAALILWLASAGESEGIPGPKWLQFPALAAVLVVFLVVLNFKLLAGFGIVVALLAAWALASCAVGLTGGKAWLAMRTITVGISFLLLRLFLERSGVESGDEALAAHYTLIGAVVGAMLPSVLSSLSLRSGLGRTVLLGFLAAVVPLLMLALWGPDVVLGLLVGFIVAEVLATVLLPLRGISAQWSAWYAPTGMMGLGMGLVMVQFGRSFEFLYNLPRIGKVYLAAGIAVVVVFWAVSMALGQLRHSSQRAEGGGRS